MLRIGLPSNGALHQPALNFMRSCGLEVFRENDRNYVGEIRSLPGATVHFQRAADITGKVEDGSVDVGIVGFDRFMENRRGQNTVALFEQLGFGGCSLVLAVPKAWIDVDSVADLTDISVDFRQAGKDLRVATKFPLLVEQFLTDRGVNHFSVVPTSGALEAAPTMGYADIIADITSSGATLRENQLMTVQGGTIIESQACLIVNTISVNSEDTRQTIARSMTCAMGARLRSQGICIDSAELPSPTGVLGTLTNPESDSIKGPS